VLLPKTSLSWHYNWSGLICASGPIKAGEVGSDYYGRPEVIIPGLPEHFVSKRADDRHFAVRYDLG
jgi:hypothetical protein